MTQPSITNFEPRANSESTTPTSNSSPPPNVNNNSNGSDSQLLSQKYKRNYRACLNCRVRKVKCDLGPVDSPHEGKCARCLRERKDCVFVESKRGGASNVINGKRKKQKTEISEGNRNSDGSVSPRFAKSPNSEKVDYRGSFSGSSGATSGGVASVGATGGATATVGDETSRYSEYKPASQASNTRTMPYATGTTNLPGVNSILTSNSPQLSSHIHNNQNNRINHNIYDPHHYNQLQHSHQRQSTPPFTPKPPNLPVTSLQSSQRFQSSRDEPQPNKSPRGTFATMEGALVFLASAAGTIAKADERDNIDARARYEQIEAISGSQSHRSSVDDGNNRAKLQSVSGKVVPVTTGLEVHGNNKGQMSSNAENKGVEQEEYENTGEEQKGTKDKQKGARGEKLQEVEEGDTSRIGNTHSGNSNNGYANMKHPGLPHKSSVPHYIPPNVGSKRMSIPPAENGYVVRPKASTKLSNIDYIGPAPNGILTEAEAERLINLFFTTMHPFFPHIPKFLHSSKVLAGYPILLCAILTIAARYHPFENNVSSASGGNVPRNIEVHDRLWLYVQRLISQTVWAEASTRSIGTIFAFLLFTEWNPRAIHWRWSDYANKAEEPSEADSRDVCKNSSSGVDASSGSGSANTTTNTNTNTSAGAGAGASAANASGNSGASNNLAGLGAMRRSHRMAWMLIGSAVRLAQDMGIMEMSSKVLIATHIAEINSVMDISRRSMLAHSLSEIEFDEDDISEEDMELVEEDEDDDYNIMKLTEEELKKIASEHTFKFTRAQKAQIELLQIMSLGHESFYGYKSQLGQLSQRQNLSVLNIISPLINNWNRKYKSFLIPSNAKIAKHVSSSFQHQMLKPNTKISNEIRDAIKQESFIFEFNYVKLYIYSLALSPSPRNVKKNSSNSHHSRGNSLKLDEMSKSAKFIEQAFNAANEMLNAAHRVHKFKMLRFMPVRWLTRMVRAVAFIVKCYLTITAHKSSSSVASNKIGSIFGNKSAEIYDPTVLSFSLISLDDISQSIHRAALTLRDCSPDELHLCTRYSNVLMYLYSEMKTKKNESEEADNEEARGMNMERTQQNGSDVQWRSAAMGARKDIRDQMLQQAQAQAQAQQQPQQPQQQDQEQEQEQEQAPEQVQQLNSGKDYGAAHVASQHIQPLPQANQQTLPAFQYSAPIYYPQAVQPTQSNNASKSVDDTFPYGPYFKHPVSEPTSASLAGIDTTTTTTTTTTDISNTANNATATTTGTAPATDTVSHTEAVVTQLGQVQQSSVDVGASSAQNVYTSRETGTPHSTATTTNTTTTSSTNTNTSTPLANIFGDAANNTSTNAAATGASANTGGFGDSEVMDWFMNNRNIGLDFVAPWTEMIEQQLNLNDQFNF